MSYVLHKRSVPADQWHLSTMDEVVDELRSHICGICLRGDEDTREDADFKPVDTEVGGRVMECRCVDTLLGTACGLEYELEKLS